MMDGVNKILNSFLCAFVQSSMFKLNCSILWEKKKKINEKPYSAGLIANVIRNDNRKAYANTKQNRKLSDSISIHSNFCLVQKYKVRVAQFKREKNEYILAKISLGSKLEHGKREVEKIAWKSSSTVLMGVQPTSTSVPIFPYFGNPLYMPIKILEKYCFIYN